jgi:predicted RNase H-like HicB family nuclease
VDIQGYAQASGEKCRSNGSPECPNRARTRLLTVLHASNTIMPTREADTILEFHIDIDREEDGRWIAEIIDLPGVLAYGSTKSEAIAAAEALALRVIADKIEQEKSSPMSITFATA